MDNETEMGVRTRVRNCDGARGSIVASGRESFSLT